MPKLKKIIVYILAGLVIGVLIWLFEFGGLEFMKKWVCRRPLIVTASTTRSTVDEFLAGEKLRFSLKDIKSYRVFWVFEEKYAIPGGVEIEHAFPFDEGKPRGQAQVRRIDAFFKSGDTYKVATTLVCTRNIRYLTKVDLDESRITVTAEAILDADWSLKGASIGKYADGMFSSGIALPVAVGEDGKSGKIVVSRGIMTKALGTASDADLRIEPSLKDAYLSYDFVNSTGDKNITIIKPIDESVQP